MLHHSFCCFASAARIVIGIAQDRFIAELASAGFEALDNFRKERVLDIRDDDAKRFPRARCESASMRVGNIPQQFHCREYEPLRLLANLSGLVQHVRNSGGRDPRRLGDIKNGEALRANVLWRWQATSSCTNS